MHYSHTQNLERGCSIRVTIALVSSDISPRFKSWAREGPRRFVPWVFCGSLGLYGIRNTVQVELEIYLPDETEFVEY